jgi:protection-of-telomeres protein 1
MRQGCGAFSLTHASTPLDLTSLTLRHINRSGEQDDMPSIGPPQGYMDLPSAQSAAIGSLVSVIGVVVDYLPPKRAYGPESTVSFKLQDPRLRDAMHSGEGLRVRFFGDEKRFPPIKAKGDIVLLRGIRVHEYANEKMLMNQRETKYLVFSGSRIPTPAFKLQYMAGSGNNKLQCEGTCDQNALSPPVQDYIITMRSEMDIPVQPVNHMPAPTLPSPNRAAQPGPGNVAAPKALRGAYSAKFKLVKDLRHYTFSDVCVEVVKKFTNNYGNCELYVTDYTANEQMFYYAPPEEKPSDLVRDGDRFGHCGPSKKEWPGPYGFLVLKVNLTEPHASFADQNVKEGDWIALENVKMKLMPDSSRLEGDMWPDQNNPTKVQVRKLRSDRKEMIDMCLRKEEYWASRPERAQTAEKQAADAEAGLSRKQRKRLRRREREEEARQKAEKEAAVAEK